jgi:hypothetical protein
MYVSTERRGRVVKTRATYSGDPGCSEVVLAFQSPSREILRSAAFRMYHLTYPLIQRHGLTEEASLNKIQVNT